MTWLSINPNSEPTTSVEVVAAALQTHPAAVTPEDMATVYNIIDPTIRHLQVSDSEKAAFVDRWIQSKRED